MKKLFIKPLWITLTAVFAVFVLAFSIGSGIAFKYTQAINSFFDITPYKVVDDEKDSDEDTEYIKSEYDDDEELWYSTEEYCQQVVAEGATLLWNNGALPLARNSKVSLFSHSSVDILYCGTGSAAFDTTGAPTLKEALEDCKFSVNDALWEFYKTKPRRTQLANIAAASNTNLYMNETPWNDVKSNCGNTFAAYGDAAIAVIARSGGEESDICYGPNGQTDGLGNNYLQLTQAEVDMLDYLVSPASEFKTVVVLINSANPLQMDKLSAYEDKIGACLWIGTPGYSGIYAVGDMLTGSVNPSGRLVDTYCYDNLSNPAMVNFGDFTWGNSASYRGRINGNGDKSYNDFNKYVVYQEGIYVGYRYYETRYEDYVLGRNGAGYYDYASVVKYPFGYGNSYTTFSYSNFSVNENKDGDYEISLTVTNTGKVRGADVVQIYMQKPYTEYDITHGLEKSAIELAGFAKTNALKPDRSQNVKITVKAEQMKTYDDDDKGTYILEKGNYYLAFGLNAHDALNNVLSKKADDGVTVHTDRMTASGDKSFVAKVAIAKDDFATYSENGKIKNRLGFADVNKYEGTAQQKIKYLTRNNWTGTWPTKVALAMNDTVANDLQFNKAISENPAAVLPKTGEKGRLQVIDMKDLDFDDPAWEEVLDRLTFDNMVKLVVNGYCATQAIEGSVNKPGTKESDGALGIGSTYARPSAYRAMGWPCEPLTAGTWNEELVYEVGQLYGEDMLHSDVSGIYSPGLNIHRNSYVGRNFEYYSEDPFISGKTASAQIRGIQSMGCYVYMKHFALNDMETNRHGVGVFADEQTIRELYLTGFEMGVKEGGARGLMSSYNRIGCIWTGGCRELQTEILRGEWGFKGVVITDYGAYAKGIYSFTDGIMAGVDKYFNSGESYDYAEYKNSPTVISALREAAHRILYVTAKSHAMNGISTTSRIVLILPWWKQALIALLTVSCVLFAASAVMTVLCFVLKKKEPVGEAVKIESVGEAAETE